MKKIIILSLVLTCVLALLSGCGAPKTLDDLRGKTVAVVDAVATDELRAALSDIELITKDTLADCFSAVDDGEAFGVANVEPLLREAIKDKEGYELIDGVVNEQPYSFAVSPTDFILNSIVEDTLSSLRESGEYDEICNRWFFGNRQMPEAELNDELDTIKFAFNKDAAPFSYENEQGEYVGFDIELATKIAENMGVGLTLIPSSGDELVDLLVSGEAEMVGTAITPDANSDEIILTYPTYIGGVAIAIKP